jgi:hypothetical protein
MLTAEEELAMADEIATDDEILAAERELAGELPGELPRELAPPESIDPSLVEARAESEDIPALETAALDEDVFANKFFLHDGDDIGLGLEPAQADSMGLVSNFEPTIEPVVEPNLGTNIESVVEAAAADLPDAGGGVVFETQIENISENIRTSEELAFDINIKPEEGSDVQA